MAFKYYIRKHSRFNSINIDYSNGRGKGNRFRLATKFKINNPNNWINEKQVVRVCKEEGIDNSKYINDNLTKLKAHFIDKINDCLKEENIISKEIVSNITASFSGQSVQKSRKENQFNFGELLNEWIEKAEGGKILKDNGKRFSNDTFKNYKSVVGHINDFESIYGKIKPSSVDKKLYKKLLVYLREDSEEEYAEGNLGAVIKNFKAAIGKVNDEYGVKFQNYISREWKVIPSNSLSTALNLEQLNKLYQLDLSDKPKTYESIRDAYCFNAFTCGLRVRDYQKLNTSNIVEIKDESSSNKIKCLKYIQSKTGQEVIAPIPDIALSILEKYDGFPVIGSEQDSNNKLKELGDWCGFNKKLYLRNDKGDVIQSAKQYELLTNHSARRTFCTIAYLNGTDTIQIMNLSGHKTEAVLLKYIKVTKEQHALRMLKTNHFKKLNSIKTLRAI